MLFEARVQRYSQDTDYFGEVFRGFPVYLQEILRLHCKLRDGRLFPYPCQFSIHYYFLSLEPGYLSRYSE